MGARLSTADRRFVEGLLDYTVPLPAPTHKHINEGLAHAHRALGAASGAGGASGGASSAVGGFGYAFGVGGGGGAGSAHNSDEAACIPLYYQCDGPMPRFVVDFIRTAVAQQAVPSEKEGGSIGGQHQQEGVEGCVVASLSPVESAEALQQALRESISVDNHDAMGGRTVGRKQQQEEDLYTRHVLANARLRELFQFTSVLLDQCTCNMAVGPSQPIAAALAMTRAALKLMISETAAALDKEEKTEKEKKRDAEAEVREGGDDGGVAPHAALSTGFIRAQRLRAAFQRTFWLPNHGSAVSGACASHHRSPHTTPQTPTAGGGGAAAAAAGSSMSTSIAALSSSILPPLLPASYDALSPVIPKLVANVCDFVIRCPITTYTVQTHIEALKLIVALCSCGLYGPQQQEEEEEGDEADGWKKARGGSPNSSPNAKGDRNGSSGAPSSRRRGVLGDSDYEDDDDLMASDDDDDGGGRRRSPSSAAAARPPPLPSVDIFVEILLSMETGAGLVLELIRRASLFRVLISSYGSAAATASNAAASAASMSANGIDVPLMSVQPLPSDADAQREWVLNAAAEAEKVRQQVMDAALTLSTTTCALVQQSNNNSLGHPVSSAGTSTAPNSAAASLSQAPSPPPAAATASKPTASNSYSKPAGGGGWFGGWFGGAAAAAAPPVMAAPTAANPATKAAAAPTATVTAPASAAVTSVPPKAMPASSSSASAAAPSSSPSPPPPPPPLPVGQCKQYSARSVAYDLSLQVLCLLLFYRRGFDGTSSSSHANNKGGDVGAHPQRGLSSQSLSAAAASKTNTPAADGGVSPTNAAASASHTLHAQYNYNRAHHFSSNTARDIVRALVNTRNPTTSASTAPSSSALGGVVLDSDGVPVNPLATSFAQLTASLSAASAEHPYALALLYSLMVDNPTYLKIMLTKSSDVTETMVIAVLQSMVQSSDLVVEGEAADEKKRREKKAALSQQQQQKTSPTGGGWLGWLAGGGGSASAASAANNSPNGNAAAHNTNNSKATVAPNGVSLNNTNAHAQQALLLAASSAAARARYQHGSSSGSAVGLGAGGDGTMVIEAFNSATAISVCFSFHLAATIIMILSQDMCIGNALFGTWKLAGQKIHSTPHSTKVWSWLTGTVSSCGTLWISALCRCILRAFALHYYEAVTLLVASLQNVGPFIHTIDSSAAQRMTRVLSVAIRRLGREATVAAGYGERRRERRRQATAAAVALLQQQQQYNPLHGGSASSDPNGSSSAFAPPPLMRQDTSRALHVAVVGGPATNTSFTGGGGGGGAANPLTDGLDTILPISSTNTAGAAVGPTATNSSAAALTAVTAVISRRALLVTRAELEEEANHKAMLTSLVDIIVGLADSISGGISITDKKNYALFYELLYHKPQLELPPMSGNGNASNGGGASGSAAATDAGMRFLASYCPYGGGDTGADYGDVAEAEDEAAIATFLLSAGEAAFSTPFSCHHHTSNQSVTADGGMAPHDVSILSTTNIPSPLLLAGTMSEPNMGPPPPNDDGTHDAALTNANTAALCDSTPVRSTTAVPAAAAAEASASLHPMKSTTAVFHHNGLGPLTANGSIASVLPLLAASITNSAAFAASSTTAFHHQNQNGSGAVPHLPPPLLSSPDSCYAIITEALRPIRTIAAMVDAELASVSVNHTPEGILALIRSVVQSHAALLEKQRLQQQQQDLMMMQGNSPSCARGNSPMSNAANNTNNNYYGNNNNNSSSLSNPLNSATSLYMQSSGHPSPTAGGGGRINNIMSNNSMNGLETMSQASSSTTGGVGAGAAKGAVTTSSSCLDLVFTYQESPASSAYFGPMMWATIMAAGRVGLGHWEEDPASLPLLRQSKRVYTRRVANH